MIEHILSFVLPERALQAIKGIKNRHFKELTVSKWHKAGCPMPVPHQIKLSTIEEFQTKSGYDILVETGTFKGDTIEAERKIFGQIISVELGKELHEKARERFRKFRHIKLYQGDGGKVLHDIVPELEGPAIFWLDGHYSGGVTARGESDCPILSELDAVLKNCKFKHIILIDDADCFIGKNDYPTIEQLTHHIKSLAKNYKIEVKYGIIRVTTD